jgi:hypothetical protein
MAVIPIHSTVIDENLVSDLKSFGINIPRQVIRYIPYDIDIQNCNVVPMDTSNHRGKLIKS